MMKGIEEEARAAGFSLLTLDAKRGGPAENLYRQMQCVEGGAIPRYALDADGRALHDTVVFYKGLI